MKFLITILFTLSITSIQSQNYELIDETVKNFPRFNSIDELVARVNNNFNTDEEKVRAFYTWTAHNISYDLIKYYAVRAPELEIKFDSEIISRSINKQKTEKIAKRVFRYRKALCIGFSSLFTELCSKSNIEVKTIKGITKTSVNYINNLNYSKNHSWNAVKINNEWKLIDITFSSGYENRVSGEWVSRFNDFYFFTDPKKLLLTHLPAQQEFQLTSEALSTKFFFKRPVFYIKYFESGLQLSNFQKGLLSASKDDKKIYITFKNKKRNGSIYYKFNDEITRKKLRIKKNEIDNYVAIIKYKSDTSRALSFYYENEKILDFKIEK